MGEEVKPRDVNWDDVFVIVGRKAGEMAKAAFESNIRAIMDSLSAERILSMDRDGTDKARLPILLTVNFVWENGVIEINENIAWTRQIKEKSLCGQTKIDPAQPELPFDEGDRESDVARSGDEGDGGTGATEGKPPAASAKKAGGKGKAKPKGKVTGSTDDALE